MATYKVTGSITHPALVDPLDVDLSVEVPDAPPPEPEPEPPPPGPEPSPEPPPGPAPEPPPEPEPGDPTVFFQDNIAGGAEVMWGFDEQIASSSSGQGVTNMTVADPTGQGDVCLELFSHPPGADDHWRNQVGVLGYRQWRQAMEDHIRTGAPVFVSMEVYFPKAFTMEPVNGAPWVSMMDWHVFRQGGGSWYHTNPGVFVHEDGSNRFRFEWGTGGHNRNSGWSTIAMPVGEWFTWEWQWQMTTAHDGVCEIFINGESALRQEGVRTALDDGHNQPIYYIKQYGQTRPNGAWQMPLIRYVRNVKITDTRVT